MLPSRMYRNLGIPPLFRSLIRIHPALSPTVRVQLRLRLRLADRYISSTHSFQNTNISESAPSLTSASSLNVVGTLLKEPSATSPSRIEAENPKIEPRLSLTMTCTVPSCLERSTHQFSKRAYEQGIVLVTCPKCKNRHLIADHIGWFKETEGTSGGRLKNIEDIMREKGEKVTRGLIEGENVTEFVQ